MSSATAHSQFVELLRQIKSQLGELSDALQQEQRALRDQHIERLGELAIQKEAYTSLINQLEQQRVQLLQAEGFGADPESMAQFVSTLVASLRGHGEQLWNEILPLAAECERLNKLNGIVLSHQQKRAQSLLALLRNEAGASDVYGANGSKEAQPTSQSLARA